MHTYLLGEGKYAYCCGCDVHFKVNMKMQWVVEEMQKHG